MLVRCEQPYTLYAAILEVYQEASPAFLAFACALARTEYFPIAVFGHSYRDKHRDACHFTAHTAILLNATNEYPNESIGLFMKSP